jgi:hypothetical protein
MPITRATHIKRGEKWPCKKPIGNNESSTKIKPTANQIPLNQEASRPAAEDIILSVGKTVFITA